MEQKTVTYHYLTNPLDNMSFKKLLRYLTQYTQPSDFYIKIQSIVKEEKIFFNLLPVKDKKGETYNRRKAELEALNNMLLKVRNDATALIYSALNEEPPLIISSNEPSELSFSESDREVNYYHCDIIISSPSPQPQSYYPDDTNLYNLCVDIINKTVEPFVHNYYLTGKNNLITKIENVVKDVGNQKITMRQHQNHMLTLANFLVLDLKKSIDESSEKEEITSADLNRKPKNPESKTRIEDLVGNSMLRPNKTLHLKAHNNRKNDKDDIVSDKISPRTMIQPFFNGHFSL